MVGVSEVEKNYLKHFQENFLGSLTFCCGRRFSSAKQRLDTNDDLFNRDDNSLDSSFAWSEAFAECASLKSIDENKQRRRCRSASKPNCLQSCKEKRLEIGLELSLIALLASRKDVKERDGRFAILAAGIPLREYCTKKLPRLSHESSAGSSFSISYQPKYVSESDKCSTHHLFFAYSQIFQRLSKMRCRAPHWSNLYIIHCQRVQ